MDRNSDTNVAPLDPVVDPDLKKKPRNVLRRLIAEFFLVPEPEQPEQLAGPTREMGTGTEVEGLYDAVAEASAPRDGKLPR